MWIEIHSMNLLHGFEILNPSGLQLTEVSKIDSGMEALCKMWAWNQNPSMVWVEGPKAHPIPPPGMGRGASP